MRQRFCRQCNCLLSKSPDSRRWSLYCSVECQKKRTAEKARAKGYPPWTPKKRTLPCSLCGTLMWSGTGVLPDGERKCMDCRRKASKAEERACSGCGTLFIARKEAARFCSRECWSGSRKGVPRGAMACINARPCLGCGADVLSSGNMPRCSACKVLHQAKVKAQRVEVYRDKCRRRRAQKKSLPMERYTTTEIAERDNLTCGICNAPVDMAIRFPDLLSPSIDHIRPLAKGGGDVKANVQLAHFGCNVRKSARWEQPVDNRPSGSMSMRAGNRAAFRMSSS